MAETLETLLYVAIVLWIGIGSIWLSFKIDEEKRGGNE